MARKASFVLFAILAAVLLIGSGLSDAGLKKSDSKVKITADASKPAAGKQTINVTLTIEDGWYIYANPVNNPDFESNRTTIAVTSGKEEVAAKISYPAGKKKATGDIVYSVYTGKVTIPVQVDHVPGAMPLSLAVRINCCNEKGICLLPATVRVAVP